jgi:ketosteroid isomerase-like protein
MMRPLRRLLCGYLLLGVVASGTASAEEALRAEDARYAAQIANDVGTMERMFAPELVFVHSTAAVNDKAVYIESIRSGTVKYRALRRSDVQVRTYGCLATITGITEIDVSSKGEDVTLHQRFHSLWVKRGDGVQFISWQATRIPPKQ